jgi:hypothetical protein
VLEKPPPQERSGTIILSENSAGGFKQPPAEATTLRQYEVPMSTLEELLIAWGALTAALIALLIYRGTLTMQEDDQLFLGESESHMAQEQIEIMQKVNKLGPFVKILGTASAALILTIAGVAVYQAVTQVQ